MRKRGIAVMLIVICIVLSLAGCGKKCENGCGHTANSSCMADMCDRCCAYWMGLNGCYNSH